MPFRTVQSIGPLGRWRCLRFICTLGIGVSYGMTYLLVSWCLATGIFHLPSDTSQASHHHAGGHAHDHHHGTSSDMSLADICDFALQVLMTSAWQPADATIAVWYVSEFILELDDDESRSQAPAILSIRSPPLFTTI